MSVIISASLAVLGAFCLAAVFGTSFRRQRLARLPLTRRTWALLGVWLCFGASLLWQERHTDFSSASAYRRLQHSRRAAAALSVLTIASYAWDMRRRKRSAHEHAILLLLIGATLVGCSRTSEREARFLNDRKVVIETVRSCFQHPYDGLNRWMSDVPSNLDFPGEEHIHRSLHASGAWSGDDQWEVTYRPAPGATNQPALPIDPTKLLDFYFHKLEASGFTSGVRGLTSLTSMQAASKSWANQDRTLLVTGYVVSDKQSGETIITTIVRETLSP